MNHNCSDITSKSVLHDIIEDKKRTFWSSHFFNFSKFKILSKSLDLCVDDNEHTLLHRSVIGGNYLAFQFLRQLGMSVYTKTRDGRNLIQLLVDSAPCFEEKTKTRKLDIIILNENGKVQESLIENISISDSYNAIASYLARETRIINDMTLLEICNHTSESLSFSHKVAAKGFIVVLLVIGEQFGSSALNCVNKNNITTDTLSIFFNHFEKFPRKFGELTVFNAEAITSLFLKILMDFKPFVFQKYSIEQYCNQRMKNFRNIRGMEICVIKLEKDYLRLLQHYVKISGIKSKEDYDRVFKKLPFLYRFYNNTDSLNSFVNYLAALKSMNENPHSSQKPALLMKDSILKSLRTKACMKKPESLKKTNSTVCCQLLSSLTKRKKDLVDLYSLTKIRKVFLLLSLYKNKLNKPFLSVDRYMMKFNEIGLADNYFHLALGFMVTREEEFYMRKKYKFWDWLKSCKNYLAKDMMNKISSSTTWEIRKWKGSLEIIPMCIDCSPVPAPKDANAPLDNYYSRFDDAEGT